MGGFSAQVQQGQTSGGGGKGLGGQDLGQAIQQYNQMPEVQGANGVVTNSATSGQPQMGEANQYNNTVGQANNPVQQPNQSMPQAGKGKGA